MKESRLLTYVSTFVGGALLFDVRSATGLGGGNEQVSDAGRGEGF